MAGWVSRRGLLAAGAAAAIGGAPAQAADLPWDLPPLKTVQAGGREIAYFEAGSGPPLLLVHGFSGSAALEWGRVLKPLAAKHRVVAPYQIGFAPSAQPDLPYDARTFVDSLGAFITAVGLKRPTIVGESFGGWVVGHYAKAEAARRGKPDALPPIARLVIVDGAVGVTPGDTINGNAESLSDPAVIAATRAFMAGQPRADNSMTKGRAGPLIRQDMIAADQLPGRALPTLVIWGDADKLIAPAVGRRLAANVPGARLAMIEACGHIPSVERPEAFLRALLGFA